MYKNEKEDIIMSRKTDTSREIRLWLGMITTVVSTAVIVASNPYIRCKAKAKYNNVKDYVERKKEEHRKKKEPHIEVVSSETISQEPL